MVSLLFSYSHKDEEMRDRLEIQLATLKRQGFIQTWHDRRIAAGEDFVNEIDKDSNLTLLFYMQTGNIYKHAYWSITSLDGFQKMIL